MFGNKIGNVTVGHPSERQQAIAQEKARNEKAKQAPSKSIRDVRRAMKAAK